MLFPDSSRKMRKVGSGEHSELRLQCRDSRHIAGLNMRINVRVIIIQLACNCHIDHIDKCHEPVMQQADAW